MRALFCLVTLLSASIAFAAEPAKDPLAPLQFFVGVWNGHVSFNEQKEVRVRYTLRRALKGRWINGNGDFKALGVAVEDFWGIDPRTGRWVRALFDSNGVTGQVLSDGWNGDVLVWEGTVFAGGTEVTVRETITRTGPGAFTAVWEQRLPDGSWKAYSRERFRRAAR